jgi:site-specific DNA recombinase
MPVRDTPETKKPIRCAVYTRKSLADGLDQDFNSLDAQREAGEAYVASQRLEGWVCLPDRYDDGGFSGANLDRPALARLLADVEAGKVDAIVIYKIDRLSRSLLDFARIMALLERHKVALVSTTQQFNSATSLGRLVLNMLLSFAQFEREMIAERTSDKMCAARRRGKWIGGMLPLGYDLAEGRLVLNEAEAALVREIFRLFLETRSLLRTAEALNARGVRTKAWTTRDGAERPGVPWTKEHLRRLVANAVYLGKVAHGGQLYAGEHAAIVDETTFARAQALLDDARTGAAPGPRNSFGYLLKGLVRCAGCGSAMSPATTKKGGVLYRYYACVAAKKRGRGACPVRSVPADALERFVVARLRSLGQDAALVDEVVAKAGAVARDEVPRLEAEERTLAAELPRVHAEARKLVPVLAGLPDGAGGVVAGRLRELEARAGEIDQRLTDVRAEKEKLEATRVDPAEARAALEAFEPVWEVLLPRERERLVHLLLEHVEYDGVKGEMALRFQPLGLRELAGEVRGATPPRARAVSAA